MAVLPVSFSPLLPALLPVFQLRFWFEKHSNRNLPAYLGMPHGYGAFRYFYQNASLPDVGWRLR